MPSVPGYGRALLDYYHRRLTTGRHYWIAIVADTTWKWLPCEAAKLPGLEGSSRLYWSGFHSSMMHEFAISARRKSGDYKLAIIQ